MADDHHFTIGGPQSKNITKTKKTNYKKKTKNGGLKVVYISNPMKFTTCASEFRALVQELTGKDSDAAAQFMDPVEVEAPMSSPLIHGRSTAVNYYGEDHGFLGFSDLIHDEIHDQEESPTCTSNSGSVFDEGTHSNLMEGMSFLDMFTSSLLNESSQLDFLRPN